MSRPHHYLFGHVVLRDIFLKDPLNFLKPLNSERIELLKNIWNQTGDHVQEKYGEAARLPSDGLLFWPRQIEIDKIAVIIKLPTPQKPPEAYCAGLFIQAPRKKMFGLLVPCNI